MISEYFFLIYICFCVLVCAVYFSIVQNKWMLLFAPPLHLLAFDTIFYFLHIESEQTLISIFFFSFLITMSGLLGSFYEASRINSMKSLAWDPTSLLKRRSGQTSPAEPGRLWDRAYLILGCVGLLLFYYILASAEVSILTLMTNKSEFARFYSGSRRGGAWMLLLVNSLAFGQIYIFFRSKKNWHGAGCILFMVILSMQGGRGILMSYIMMLLMIRMWHTGSGRAIPAMVSVAALVFLLASFLRAGNLDEYVNSMSIFYDFNLAHVYEECRAYVDENGTEWGLFTSDVVLYIPRAFWPEKPMSTAETLLIYPDVALSGTSYTFGLYGNSLLHMNQLGIVIICLFYAVLGIAFIRFDTKAISAGGAFIFITLLSMELLWLRGGMFAVRAATVAGTSLIGWKAAEFFSQAPVQQTFIPISDRDRSKQSHRKAA
jgi:hypothetical protein